MTLDLFADDPIAAAPAPAPAPAAPAPVAAPEPIARLPGEVFALEPMLGELNRWTYKGEIITYDSHKLLVVGRGRWASVEGIGKPVLRGDSHVDVCRAIDARLAAAES